MEAIPQSSSGFRESDFFRIENYCSSQAQKLDLRGFVSLEVVIVLGRINLTAIDISNCPNLFFFDGGDSLPTSLDVSNNPKLTDLFINAELFYPENKIIGLEKTSI